MSGNQQRPGTLRIEVGTKFRYDGEAWTVIGLEAGVVRVRGPRGLAILSVAEVATSAEVIDRDEDEIDEAQDVGSVLSDQTMPASLSQSLTTPQMTKSAEPRMRLVNLLLTGYEDGVATEDVEPSEFGPLTGVPFKQRLALLAAHEGIGDRTLERWCQQYRDHGSAGLLDKRMIAIADPLGNCPTEIRVAMQQVLSLRAEKSKVTDNELMRQIMAAVRRDHGADYRFPTARTMRRYLAPMKAMYALHLSTKTLQGNALRPKRPFKPILTTRPFELVEIDSTPLDVFAISQIDGKPTHVTLTVAIDVYDRAPVAWQFSGGEAKSVDATMLIHDILSPKPLNPAWHESAAWRFGIPETVVLHTYDLQGPLAGVPFGVPTTLSLDNGAMYISADARSACARLGINLQYARVSRPTDKPHVERFFATVRTQFLEKLPGYKGPNVESRGTVANVEGQASLFIWEIEALFAEWVATVYMNTPHGGLRVPSVPSLELTPAEAFNRGIAMTGFYTIPADPDLAISLLPSTARTISHQGIEVDGLLYNSEDLDVYRKRKSPFLDLKGRWPIRYDDRDKSGIWFWAGDLAEPTIGAWIRIPSNVFSGTQPFADVELDYVKSLFTPGDRMSGRQNNTAVLAQATEAYLRRIDERGPANRKEARVATIGRDRTTQAASNNLSPRIAARTPIPALLDREGTLGALDDFAKSSAAIHQVANVTIQSEDDFFTDEYLDATDLEDTL